MNIKEHIKEILENKRWIKNDTGLWKIQCCKLFEEKERLMLLIVTDELNGPSVARVNKIGVLNEDEIVLFYDNEYNSVLEENEYESYSKILTKEEWDILFSGEAAKKLYNINIISDTSGFYVEPHVNMEKFIYECKDYNEKESIEVSKYFNI